MKMKDFSEENPKLHTLYVTYAQEDLQLIAAFLAELETQSRVNRAIMAGMLNQYRAGLIKDDAAYREAAWRILADNLVSTEEPQANVG